MNFITDQLIYNLDIDSLGFINIITGFSGTGKTVFINVCDGITKGSTIVDYPINVVPILSISNSYVFEATISTSIEPSIFIIDEDTVLLSRSQLRKDIARVIKSYENSKHKFILVTRDKSLSYLFNISVDCTFTIKEISGKNYIQRVCLEDYLLDAPSEIKSILVEDSGSCLTFLKNYFKPIKDNIEPAYSKDNVCGYITNNNFTNGLVVFDAASFGFNILTLLQVIGDNKIIAWECFEEYILRSPNLISYYKEHINPNPEESDYYKLLHAVIPKYTKSKKLTHCLEPDFDCNKDCHERCQWAVENKRAKYIHDELSYIQTGDSSNVEEENSTFSFEPLKFELNDD